MPIKIIRNYLFFITFSSVVFQSATIVAMPLRFHQNAEPIPSLFGTEIGDIVWSGKYLWVATESGVARLDPNTNSGMSPADWVTFTYVNGIGRGSISALDAIGDTVWVSTIIDTVTSIGTRQMGTGLSFSHNAGKTWTLIPGEKIFDASNLDFSRGPTTQIDNGCFDISIGNNAIWAAFFAGSTVRISPDGTTYSRVLPDGANEIVYFTNETAADSLQLIADSLSSTGADPLIISQIRTEVDSLASQSLLHRTFSVLSYGDTTWIGTSNGLARSFDNGETWQTSKVRFDNSGILKDQQIGGNWVLSIDRNINSDGRSVIWVGTNTTGLPGERPSISYSLDNGANWTITGETYAWDFAFTNSYIWATTSENLLRRPLNSNVWESVVVNSGEKLNGVFVGVEYLEIGDQSLLWVGAENGLGLSLDEGENWSIVRDLVRTPSLDSNLFVGEGAITDTTNKSYAAPNPFAPSSGESALIIFSLSQNSMIDLDIFDFSSRKVTTLIKNTNYTGGMNHAVPWNGRDNKGRNVANGTYFYRIHTNLGRAFFGTVVVLD